MEILNDSKMIVIEGGAAISGALINSFSRAINVVLDLGRAIGSAIRRVAAGSYCKI